jgi:hypothetical protein
VIFNSRQASAGVRATGGNKIKHKIMEIFADNICLTGEEIAPVIGKYNFEYLLRSGKISNAAGKACYGM